MGPEKSVVWLGQSCRKMLGGSFNYGCSCTTVWCNKMKGCLTLMSSIHVQMTSITVLFRSGGGGGVGGGGGGEGGVKGSQIK